MLVNTVLGGTSPLEIQLLILRKVRSVWEATLVLWRTELQVKLNYKSK